MPTYTAWEAEDYDDEIEYAEASIPSMEIDELGSTVEIIPSQTFNEGQGIP